MYYRKLKIGHKVFVCRAPITFRNRVTINIYCIYPKLAGLGDFLNIVERLRRGVLPSMSVLVSFTHHRRMVPDPANLDGSSPVISELKEGGSTPSPRRSTRIAENPLNQVRPLELITNEFFF